MRSTTRIRSAPRPDGRGRLPNVRGRSTMGEKQGNSETRQCWVVRLAEKKCCKTICLAAAAVVLLVMYVLAARDAGTSEFAVKLTHELAWPLAAVALLAFVYAGELRRLIGGLKRFKLPGGIEAEVLGEEAQAQLDRKIQESGAIPKGRIYTRSAVKCPLKRDASSRTYLRLACRGGCRSLCTRPVGTRLRASYWRRISPRARTELTTVPR